MDTTLNYWVNEYMIDGFRFDLSKGFTQKKNTDVGAWGAKDDSRIAILKRMADKVWENDPDNYVILEHFADNSEETILADYGMMLWGNSHWDYKDLGIGTSKNISWTYYGSRGWQEPNLVSYMESHDEERIVYELLQNGKSSGNYDIKTKKNALGRMKALAAFFYSVPGPKMLWQFGELAYDKSITLCEDGSLNDGCRTSPKPVKWDYYEDEDRLKLRQVVAELIHLKRQYSVFNDGQFSITDGNTLLKEIILINKDDIQSPSNAEEMSVYIIGNFDVKSVNVNTNFPFTGTWYSFFDGGEEWDVTNVNSSIELKPGEFKLFVNYSIDFPDAELVNVITGLRDHDSYTEFIQVYPNPSSGFLAIDLGRESKQSMKINIFDLSGRMLQSKSEFNHSGVIELDLNILKPGPYLMTLSNENLHYSTLIIKE